MCRSSGSNISKIYVFIRTLRVRLRHNTPVKFLTLISPRFFFINLNYDNMMEIPGDIPEIYQYLF